MQISDIKHRQKSSNKQQNGEKRRSEDEKKKKDSVIRDSFSPDEKKKDSFSAAEKKESVIIRESFRADVKFCVSLMCLALSVIVAWSVHLSLSLSLILIIIHQFSSFYECGFVCPPQAAYSAERNASRNEGKVRVFAGEEPDG